MRAGTYPLKPPLPYTPGSDGAGVVEAVGEGVKKVRANDRVYTGRTVSGSYAEYTLALEEEIHLLPAKVDFKQGAGIGSLWDRLSCAVSPGEGARLPNRPGARCKWRRGPRGSSNWARHGSEGSWHCRNARAWRSPKREGAHAVFDHSKAGYQDEILEATGNRGVDIILEMLANVNLSHDTKLLANNGRVIVIGNRGEVTINPRELMGRRASIRGFTLWGITPTEEADIHAGIFAGLENGTLRPVIGKELPLADASRAHKEILEPGSAGKIVLIC